MAEAVEPLNLSKLPKEESRKLKGVSLHPSKSAKVPVAGKSRRLLRKPVGAVVEAPAVEVNAVVEPVAEVKVIEAPVAEVKVVEANISPCAELFDPCTREPIASLEALEKRVRQLKKERNAIPIGLYGLTNKTSNYDFLTTVFVNPAISMDDMVSFELSKGRHSGTDIYEVLSRLFVFFGGIEGVNPREGGNYKFMDRVEGGGKLYATAEEALKSMKCIASKGTGVSDITLINSDPSVKAVSAHDPYCEVECSAKPSEITKTYLMSVKWRKIEKNAENVDLEKLRIAQQESLTAEQQPADSIVFIKSKKDFQIANNRMYRQYVQTLAKTFFGWNEDVKPFLEEKRRAIFEMAAITGVSPNVALAQQYFKAGSKPVLSLQLHQDIIVQGVCNTIATSDNNIYLIGVLPRGGKTFIAGGIIREYLQRMAVPNLNIFWLTAAPNETFNQVKDELLNRFHDFADFEFIEVKTMADIVSKKTKPHTVFFCSSQLLIASQKKDAKKRETLQGLLSGKDKLGLVFFDEAHKTGTGDKTKTEIQSILDTYSHLKLPFIFLTATYYNILFDFHIQKENLFIWDYTDVLATRALATESEQGDAVANLQNRFGTELVNTVIAKRKSNGETLETMAKAYIGFPDLYFISADFQEEALARFTEQGSYRPDAGFSLTTIFAIKPGTTIADVKTADNKVRSDAYRIFDNITNPKNIISLITPKDAFDVPAVVAIKGGEPLTKEGPLEPSILGRIHRISSESKSRFRLDEQPTLLMFMPTGGIGTNIFYLLCAWASLLMTHAWWRENYEIACIVSEENVGNADMKALLERAPGASDTIHIINKHLKTSILALERKLHCQEKPKGLLLLAGEKLSMGISLPCTDVVFLFNEKKSPDDIIQKMYRALTPSPGKQSAFVVDLNPVRTLAALYGYTRASHKSSNTVSQILDIIYDTYSWDSDVFEYSLRKGADAKPLSFQNKLRQLFEMAEKDPTNDYRINEDIGGFEKKMGNDIRRSIDADFIGKIASHFSSKKMEATLGRIGLKEGSTATLEKGRLVIRAPRPESESESKPVEDIEIVIDNFIETIADFVKYLAITSTSSKLEDALKEYEDKVVNAEGSTLQNNVLRLVRSRTEIKEGEDKELLSKLLIAAVKDFAASSSERVFRQMKGKIEERSLRKDKILDIIHKRLTPRQKQKQDLGEVFTPIDLIENMLSQLPKSVWSNHNLKWLDPANGIGNFPVIVFYKLDEGLKSWESNENKRRKHIIENMLFMLEKQSNNNRIARNIFEKLCDKCVPNILTANSLEITGAKLKAKGWPEKYDIIMGNPPYQTGGSHQSGTTVWPKFIELYVKCLSPNGFMLFINGQGWREFANGEILDLMKTMNLLNITIMGKAFPGINFPVDYFLLQNNTAYKTTKITNNELSMTQNIDIRHLSVIPNFGWDIFERWSERKLPQLQVIRSNETSSTKKIFSQKETATYQYPIIMNINGSGHKTKYSNIKHSLQDKIKVLTSFGSSLYPFVDSKGIYGISENVFAILCDTVSDAEAVKAYLENPMVVCLLQSLKIGTYAIKNKLLSIMPDPLEFKGANVEKSLLLTEKDKTFLTTCKFVTEDNDEPAEKHGKQRRITRKNKNV